MFITWLSMVDGRSPSREIRARVAPLFSWRTDQELTVQASLLASQKWSRLVCLPVLLWSLLRTVQCGRDISVKSGVLRSILVGSHCLGGEHHHMNGFTSWFDATFFSTIYPFTTNHQSTPS